MMKKFKHGLVFGKFLPVHNGHLHLVNTALEQCEDVTVLVCSLKSEPIFGWVRYDWMCELAPNAIVKHITDEVPQHPDEHPDFWEIWTKLLTKNMHPETDVVFTSENYGFEVAERLGIQHVLVDIDRKTVPVSGTAVRTNAFEVWDYIPKVVRGYFSKKIAVVGTESTGKSTTAKILTGRFLEKGISANYIPEFARDYCDEKIKNGVKDLDKQDFLNIAYGHIDTINNGTNKGFKLNFIDTDLCVTEAYANMYLGSCPEFISDMNALMQYDLTLLMDIDLPWEQDSTRIYLSPDQRKEYFEMLKSVLDKHGRKYILISGLEQERIDNAFKVVQKELMLMQAISPQLV